MSDPSPSLENWIQQATDALENGDNQLAIHLARQALESDPESELAYLILAGAVSDLEESLRYLNRALEINPKSQRARDGVHWALRMQRAQSEGEAGVHGRDEVGEVETGLPGESGVVGDREGVRADGWTNEDAAGLIDIMDAEPEHVGETTAPLAVDDTGPVRTQPLAAQARGRQAGGGGRKLARGGVGLSGAILAILPWLAAFLVGAFGLGIWFFTSGNGDGLRPGWIFGTQTAPPTVSVRTLTATLEEALASPTLIDLSNPTAPAAETEAPEVTATPEPSAIPLPTNTPDIPVVEITPISALPPSYEPPVGAYEPPSMDYTPSNGQHWVDINLTNQRAYAYDGDGMVREFIVSTGTWLHPTITGQFYVYIKFVADDMSGPGYYLPDVPYVQYFYKDYALHGTYWHSNFGTPMSHGCINFTTPDAAWLFDWIGVGDLVNIHY